MAAYVDDGRPDIARGLDLDVRILARDLARWATRGDTGSLPGARDAEAAAVRAIDRMLICLHHLRSDLAEEIRACDDATAATGPLAERKGPQGVAEPKSEATS